MKKILLIAIMMMAGLSAQAQDRKETEDFVKEKKLYEKVRKEYVSGNYEAVAAHFDSLFAKRWVLSLRKYKMASETYLKLSEAQPAKADVYLAKSEKARSEALRWLGEMIFEENWDQIDLEEKESEQEIFTIVDVKPQFAGGDAAMYQFLADSITYPEKARNLGIEGRVFVQFIVNKDGSLDPVQVIKGIGAGCDEEAVRVVKLMPDWSPGEVDGEVVPVRMVLPIYFALQADSKKKKKRRGKL